MRMDAVRKLRTFYPTDAACALQWPPGESGIWVYVHETELGNMCWVK